MFKDKRTLIIGIAILVVLMGIFLILNPRVQESLGWHTAQFLRWLNVKLDPPEAVEFVSPGIGTPNLAEPSVTVLSTPTPTPEVAAAQPEEQPIATFAPLPRFVELEGTTYFNQHNRWNYCGPANLAMALSFWDWEGTHDDVARVVKPYQKDKSVMPYEMVDYVKQQTDLDALMRVGGDFDTVKRLISNGYPVIVEKGPYFRDISYRITWMGHYQLLTGYDDELGIFIAQDSYINADHQQPYADLVSEWRSFNYTYVVIFPQNERNDVLNLLGPNSDEDENFAWQRKRRLLRSIPWKDWIVSLPGITTAPTWLPCATTTARPRLTMRRWLSIILFQKIIPFAPTVFCGIKRVPILPISTPLVTRMSSTWLPPTQSRWCAMMNLPSKRVSTGAAKRA